MSSGTATGDDADRSTLPTDDDVDRAASPVDDRADNVDANAAPVDESEPAPMSLDRDASDRTLDRQLAYLGLLTIPCGVIDAVKRVFGLSRPT